jgi:hypothetical protein
VAEVAALAAVLVAGAGLRFWLSTATPFDAHELAILTEANNPGRGLRVPALMFNGGSLLALYLLVRRSAGVPAAFAVLLLLQTSLTFQDLALRLRLASFPLAFVLGGLTALRWRFPAASLPSGVGRALAALAAVLALRGAWLGATLPSRLTAMHAAAAADPVALGAAFARCGDPWAVPIETFRTCGPGWAASRSLDQQEALMNHRLRLGAEATAVATPGELPAEDGLVVVFDPAGAGYLVVPAGPLSETAVRVSKGDARFP